MLKRIIYMFLMIMFFVTPTFAASINVDVDSNDKIDLAYGGLNVGLSDPNDDRVLFWDDSSGSIAWLDLGEGLNLEGSILSAPLVQDTTPQLGGNLDSNNFNIYVGDGTYSWDHSPDLGVEGTLEVDGVVYADGGIQSGATATPGITLNDSDTTEESVDAKIYANATDTGNGTEDVDIYIQGLSSGVLTNFVHFDADGSAEFNQPISGSSLTLTGDIKGNVPVTLDTDAAITLSASDCKGGMRINDDNDVIDYTLPPASAGLSVTFYSKYAAVVTVDTYDTSDTIILNGTLLTAGNAIDSAGEAGNFISLLAIDDSTWISLECSGNWTDGGAD